MAKGDTSTAMGTAIPMAIRGNTIPGKTASKVYNER